MAAGKGRLVLPKQGAVGAGTTVAGAKETSIKLNNEQVDITNKDSSGYRTLLEGAGTQSISISLSGVFTDAAVEETVRGYAYANSINTFHLLFPNADTLQGNFAISNYERAGGHNNEETYNFTLESSGQWTFTAA